MGDKMHMKMNVRDTIILGVLFAVAVLIAIYFEPNMLSNPFVPVVLLIFYLTLLISHFATYETKKV